MKNEEIKLFRRFLKDNGVYAIFVKNYDPFYTSCGRQNMFAEDSYIDFKTYIEKISISVAISSAFRWEDSPEKTKFWSDIHEKWFTIIKEMKFHNVNKFEDDILHIDS